MKNLSTLFIFILISAGAFAQDAEINEKNTKKKSKSSDVQESSDEKVSDKKDDASVFIGEPEDGSYSLENRRSISSPSMPMYNVEQKFNDKKKKKKQQDAYMNDDYYFPAKPKNAWQIGIRGGISQVNGDVNQTFFKGSKHTIPGYTFGATVIKPFTYMFSMRLNYDFMEMWNQDWQQSELTEDLIRGTDYNLASYINNNPNGSQNLIYHNSHTVAHDLTMDAVVSFGNIRFHKERSKFVFNTFITGGGFIYQTWYDHLDANGDPYDYGSITSIADGASKGEVLQELDAMRNGVYETLAEGHPDSKNGSFINNYSFRPVFGGGAGFTVRLNRVMNFDFQVRMMFTRDDLVDGHRWQEPDGNSNVNLPTRNGGGLVRTSRGLTRDFDTYTNTTMGITFKLVNKKKTESATLLNPIHYTYQKIAENDPEKAIEELLLDDDKDGVPNRLDQEENTPEGAPVSPKGIALDSDADGIIDLNDDEPFSPPGLPVNLKGVAQLPPSCCDEMMAVACSNVILPSVHFDKDKFNIKPEFYAHLHDLATKMGDCPDLVIRATGMTDKDDNQKYNEQLSWNRANAVIDYLTEKYGINRDRFILKFSGESNAEGSSNIEQYKERKVSLEQANADEMGESNPAPPHPGLKAGTNK